MALSLPDLHSRNPRLSVSASFRCLDTSFTANSKITLLRVIGRFQSFRLFVHSDSPSDPCNISHTNYSFSVYMETTWGKGLFIFLVGSLAAVRMIWWVFAFCFQCSLSMGWNLPLCLPSLKFTKNTDTIGKSLLAKTNFSTIFSPCLCLGSASILPSTVFSLWSWLSLICRVQHWYKAQKVCRWSSRFPFTGMAFPRALLAQSKPSLRKWRKTYREVEERNSWGKVGRFWPA